MIFTLKHLAFILKTDLDILQNIILNIDTYYYSFQKEKINKDTGEPLLDKEGKVKTREVNATKKELKQIQKRIYKLLIASIKLPDYAFGGIPKRDNISNAKYHQGNKYVFTTDLKSFFPSISHTQVFNVLIEHGFSPSVSRILTQLITYKYQVPQGVPTSTFIANLVFKKTGDKILDFARQNNIKFSIFVDDITLSSKIDFKDKIPHILDILKKDGYKISYQKTFYKTKNPIITGVICQNNLIKLPNNTYKRLKRYQLKQQIDSTFSNKYNGLKRYKDRVKEKNIHR